MKFLKINFFVVFIAFMLCIVLVNSQEENKRNVLLRRPGGVRPGGPLSKQTSTTTAAPSAGEEDVGEEEYEQEVDETEKEQQDDTSTSTTTTTEPPKKIGPIVRPFRSNEDLLNALKRRQQNQRKGGKAVEKPAPKAQDEQEKEEEPAPAPVQKTSDRATGGRRSKFSKALRSTGSAGDNLDEQPAASSSSVKRPGKLGSKA